MKEFLKDSLNNMEEAQVLNPFGYLSATKVLDENRKPSEWWIEYLEFNEVVAENEFYVLFGDGLLIKKGRSKFTTSQYLKGDRFISFKQYYGKENLLEDDWVLVVGNLPS
jgi:hypothetical protein